MSRNRSPGGSPDFDALARIYRWMEWFTFGPWLSKCRLAFLDRLEGRRRALILGDGDGRFSAALLRAHRDIEINAVDASPAMMEELVRHAGQHRRRVRAEVIDARRWTPAADRHYDMVATHFFLDCLTSEEVGQLAHAVRPALVPGAIWLVSEFAIPKGLFGKWLARSIVAALYAAFGVLTGLAVRRLPDYRAALRDAGFEMAEGRRFLGGLLVSEMWRNTGPIPDPVPNVTNMLKSMR
jgi:hypothetical protein